MEHSVFSGQYFIDILQFERGYRMKGFKRLTSLFVALAIMIGGVFLLATVPARASMNEVEKTDNRMLSFNEGWKFRLLSGSNFNDTSLDSATDRETGARLLDYDDSGSDWSNVGLPHDWSIYLDYGGSGARAAQGSLQGGTGWYRKSFTLPDDFQGKEISIQFDGIMQVAEVYVNGVTNTAEWKQYLGYTTFDIDITDHLKFNGEKNVIAVKCQASNNGARWYQGAGIYRNVWLRVTDSVYVPTNGVYITTPKSGLSPAPTPHEPIENPTSATVNISTDVTNYREETQSVSVKSTVYDKGGDIVNAMTDNTDITAGGSITFTQALVVPNPKLWSVDAPNLYWIRTEVIQNGNVVDTINSRFGFRYIDLDSDTGMYINGKLTELQGVCEHSDLGPLGMETYQDAIDRRIRKLKAMGCNAIRTGHNPVSPEYIEACDRLGMMVMEEAFDQWCRAKNSGDYSNYFNKSTTDGTTNVFTVSTSSADITWPDPGQGLTSNAERDIKAMVDRDKNSPAVVIWSTGNEIDDHKYSYAPNLQSQLMDWIREVETESETQRPIIAVPPWWDNASGQFNNYFRPMSVSDIGGFNYATSYYERGHREYPDLPLVGAETVSAFASRGKYYPETYGTNARTSHGGYSSEYPFETNFELANTSFIGLRDNPSMLGEFVWTGHDYMGEPTPHGGGAMSSVFGIIDTCSFEKDSFYMYKSMWTDEPTCHLVPQNWTQWTAGQQIPIIVYTNGRSVDLYLNGNLIGTKNFNKATSDPVYIEFGKISFEQGELKAVAKDINGNVIATDVIYTADEASNVELVADRAMVENDGDSLIYVEATVRDSAGTMVPDAENRIFVQVEGGRVIAHGNGSNMDRESQRNIALGRKSMSGKALFIVAADKDHTGPITITSSSDGLISNTITVDAVPVGTLGDGTNILDYEKPNITVGVGIMPELPDTIRVMLDNGLMQDIKVRDWNLSEVDINTAGSYVADGTSDAISGSIEANIHVKEIEEVKDINITSIVGISPPLPMFVTINYTDGTVGAAPVTWEDVETSKYAGPGTFDIAGSVGPTLKVTAHVTVKAFATADPITVYTTVKKAPDMPDGVKVKFNDGSEEIMAVDWKISEDNYAYPGSSVITGNVLGSAFEVKATVKVQTAVYLSDLKWLSEAPSGSAFKDTTVGGNKLGARGSFGGPPVEYQKGIGTQAPCEIEYDISGMGFNVFQSYVSLSMDDGGMTGRGAVKFEVYLDDVKKYESDVMDRQSEAVLIDLDVTGVSKLKIVTIAAGSDGVEYDLGDWCDAKFLSDNIHVSNASLIKQVYTNSLNVIPALPTVAKATVPGVGEVNFKINWPTLTTSMFNSAGVQRIYGTLEGANGSNVLVKVITDYNSARTAADFHEKLGMWTEVEKFDFSDIASGDKKNFSTLTLIPRLIYSATSNMLVENVQNYGFRYGAYPSSSASGNQIVFATPALTYFKLTNIASTTAISEGSSFSFETSPDGSNWTALDSSDWRKGAIVPGTGTGSVWARRTYSSNEGVIPDGVNFLRVTYPGGNTWQFNTTEIEFGGGGNTMAADIESFRLGGNAGAIDQNAGTINVYLPYGTDVTDLAPEIVVSEGADVNPKDAQDFTNPVVYTVTNGAKENKYTVTVSVDEGVGTDLFSFAFAGRAGRINGQDVTVYVPSDTYMTDITPVVTLSPGAAMSKTVLTFSFDAPTKFTVISANGKVSKEYTVTVIEQNGLLTTPVASPLVLATTDELGIEGLPKQIEFNLDNGGTAMADVEWSSGTFAAYTTVESLIGTATFGGSVVNFTAQVEVIKPGTMYWVSSASTSTGSIYYDAVKTFLGSQLYNTVSDKNYTDGSWGVRKGTGHTTDGRNITPTAYGSPGYGLSKWSAFWGGSNNTSGNNYEYVIPDLPAGTYTIAIGNTESWGTGTRTMTNSVYPLDTPRENALWDSGTFSYANNARITSTGTFTLTETTSIIVRFTAVNAQAPCVAWFAISNPEIQSPDTITGLATPIPNPAVYVQDANPDGIAGKLPATATATTIGAGNVSGTIKWDLSSIPAQSRAYDTVVVQGVFTAEGSGLTMDVSTYVEIVPRGLKYFIDAGSMVTSSVQGRKEAGSRAWDSVSALVGSDLLNANSADQPFESGWGYTTGVTPANENNDTMHPVINEDAQWYRVPDFVDKYNYGWFSKGKLVSGADDAVIEYQLTLPAGDYMLTSGTREYWPPVNKEAGNNRPYKIEILDSSGALLASLDSSIVTENNAQWGEEQVDTLFFTLPEDGAIRYRMTTLRDKHGSGTNSTDGDAGHQVSWLAVADAGFYATPITTGTTGTSITTNVLLENYTDSPKTGCGLLAGYDTSYKLTVSSFGEEFAVNSSELATTSVTLPNKGSAANVKLFIWDKNYIPMCEAETIF